MFVRFWYGDTSNSGPSDTDVIEYMNDKETSESLYEYARELFGYDYYVGYEILDPLPEELKTKLRKQYELQLEHLTKLIKLLD
jgi:hypothetical protein